MNTKIKKIRNLLFALATVLLLVDGAYIYLTHTDTGGNAIEVLGSNEVHFIDVGQGDSTLLISGNEAVLIDAGEKSGGDAVVAHLNALGIDTLSAVIATHPHADHIGGMSVVLSQLNVNAFYMGPETANTNVFSNMLDGIEAQGLTPKIPTPGDTFQFASGAVLYFLAPNDSVSADNLNNRSIICLFDTGTHTVLLTGDAEKPAEASLLADFPTLQCDVLKVGHHGSNTSTTEALLATTQPQIAVISCGANNDYGHPHAQTLEALAAYGVNDLHITAEEGTIMLNLDTLNIRKENAA